MLCHSGARRLQIQGFVLVGSPVGPRSSPAEDSSTPNRLGFKVQGLGFRV